MMRTANPALNAKTFSDVRGASFTEAMTINGTVNKTFALLACALVTAAFTWNRFMNTESPQAVVPWLVTGALGGFVVAIVTVFKRTWAPVTAPLYALLEGLVLGTVSAAAEVQFPGIAVQAVALTFGTLLCLLVTYRAGIIRATENFKLGVAAATGGIVLLYLVSFVLGLFGVHLSFLHESGLIGIGFSLFVVVIAALNLVLDFDFIEGGAAQGAPKYMEWYAAFGLMVTLIWLYLEILRLLSKLRRR